MQENPKKQNYQKVLNPKPQSPEADTGYYDGFYDFVFKPQYRGVLKRKNMSGYSGTTQQRS